LNEVVCQWHPAVVTDFAALEPELRGAYLELVDRIQADPKIGDHLDARASTGDLSAYRKLKFGHDSPRGPSHRVVYQLLPDNYAPSTFRVIAVRSRDDVYAIAAERTP
jgi:hypothetical protein